MVRGQQQRGISPDRYLRVVVIAGVLLTLIIFTGAAVRLTDSGLGCENWPECSDERLVPEASFHGWVEFGNRLLSGVVALGTIAAALFAYRRHPRRQDLIGWAWLLVAGVAAQVVLGGITVMVDLHPLFVSAHFLLSIVLLWNVVVLWFKASGGVGAPTANVDVSIQKHGLGLLAASSLLLVTGTMVTGSGPNSGDFRADRFNLDLTTAARVHSVTAWIFLGVLVTLAIRMQRTGAATTRVQPVVVVSLAQGAIGYTQYLNGVPPALVMAHVIGAVLLWLLTLRLYFGFFDRPNEVGGITPKSSRSSSSNDPVYEANFAAASSPTPSTATSSTTTHAKTDPEAG